MAIWELLLLTGVSGLRHAGLGCLVARSTETPRRPAGPRKAALLKDGNKVTGGQFVNFRIRALFLLIELLKCETSHAFSSHKILKRLHPVGGDPV
jgi:hypothetical protein